MIYYYNRVQKVIDVRDGKRALRDFTQHVHYIYCVTENRHMNLMHLANTMHTHISNIIDRYYRIYLVTVF